MADVSLSNEEMDLAIDRYRDRLIAGEPTDPQEIRALIEAQENGGWPDVDYDDRSRTDWDPSRALDRVADLASAYRDPDHALAGSEEVRDVAVRGLEYWLAREPESDNWWHNDIGAPRAMRDVLALAGPWLDAETREDALAVLGRVEAEGTGANLLWTAEIEFMYGCFASERRRATDAAREAIDEIRVTTGDGIQPDYSFHQHGPTLQQYHYGESFVDSVASFAALVGGTGCGFPADRLDLAADLVLEGHRWMQRGGVASPATLDRAVSRPGALSVAGETYRRLAGLVEARAGELDAFADHVEAGVPAREPPVEGHCHYWRSDFSVHHRPGVFASLKTVSERTRNTESINEENLKGRYLTAGALYVTLAGDEYHDIFPLWDWTRVPGVTAYADSSRMTEPERRAFAGGLETGGYGVHALDYGVGEGSLEARKAWFFGDRAIACLGAGITAEEGGVVTTLAQRHLRGTVQVRDRDETRTISEGAAETIEATGLRHDGISYRLREPTAIEVSARERTGSWHDINHARDGTVSGSIFTAAIDHGPGPTGESYAYVVTPDTDDGAPGEGDGAPANVLVNTPSRQAVHFPEPGLHQAVFHEPGRIDISGSELRVDAPCLAQHRDGVLTVADPTRALDEVAVGFGDRSLVADVSGGTGDPPQDSLRL